MQNPSQLPPSDILPIKTEEHSYTIINRLFPYSLPPQDRGPIVGIKLLTLPPWRLSSSNQYSRKIRKKTFLLNQRANTMFQKDVELFECLHAPTLAVKTTILNSLSNMWQSDLLLTCKVSNSTRHFKNTVIGSSRQIEPLHS